MNEQQFAQLQTQAHDGEAAVVLAAVDNDPGLISRATEENGDTLFHGACLGGHVGLARRLLDRKADVNQRDNLGVDALMWASAAGHCNIIELLTSRGADIDARDDHGWTALAYATSHDKYPACLCLISKRADLIAVDKEGKNPLDHYGVFADPPLTSRQAIDKRRDSLRRAWAEGPHPSQEQRREGWELP